MGVRTGGLCTSRNGRRLLRTVLGDMGRKCYPATFTYWTSYEYRTPSTVYENGRIKH
jgi:hypothetical protein